MIDQIVTVLGGKATKTFSDAIVVWPEDLRHLDSFLQRKFSHIEYVAKTEDNTELGPTNLNTLLEYENPDFRKLDSITIRATNADGDNVANEEVEIVLGNTGPFSYVTALVKLAFSDINTKVPIEDEIIKRVRAMHPWYSWLTKIPFKYSIPLVLFILSFALNLINVIKKIYHFESASVTNQFTFSDNESFSATVLIVGVLLIIGYMIDRSRDYLFPRYFFCIGRQLNKFKKKQNVAYTIFGIILLGIAINIASSMIWSSITP